MRDDMAERMLRGYGRHSLQSYKRHLARPKGSYDETELARLMPIRPRAVRRQYLQLNPVARFLWKNTGRPWNDVFVGISQLLRQLRAKKASTRPLERLLVANPPEFGPDGLPYAWTNRGRLRPIVRTGRTRMFVDQQGLLRRLPQGELKRGERWLMPPGAYGFNIRYRRGEHGLLTDGAFGLDAARLRKVDRHET